MANRPVGEPTSLRAKVTGPGTNDKRRQLQKLLTLETISEWIRLQGFDEYTTNGLIEMASKYPTRALPGFRKNFNLMIERVRAKRRAELRGHEQEKTEGDGDGGCDSGCGLDGEGLAPPAG